MEETGKSQEFYWLSALEALTAVWLLLSQAIATTMQGGGLFGSRLAVSSLSLVLLLAVITLLVKLQLAGRNVGLCLVAELLLIGLAALMASISGFQLLVLCLVGKAGLYLKPQHWAGFSLLSAGSYFAVSNFNSQLFVQSSSGFSSSASLLGVFVGRELPGLLAGAGLVVGLVWAMQAERRHRQELERLAQHVEQLSAELERSKVLAEIDTSMGGLLREADVRVKEVIEENLSETSVDKVAEARELAGEALTCIRGALKLLRSETSEETAQPP